MSYVSVPEMRAEGVPITIPDAAIQSALDMWQPIIERITRRVFEPQTLTVFLDGSGSDTLFLNLPIISITALYMNNDFVNVVPSDNYAVYNARGPRGMPDDRDNPKIRLIVENQSIFTATSMRAFARGKQNQQLQGSFGYVELDGSTPEPIKFSLKKLAIKQLKDGGINATGMWRSSGTIGPAGPIVAESVAGRSVQYANPWLRIQKTGTIRVTGDPQVDEILQMYKGPPIITAPFSTGEDSIIIYHRPGPLP